MAYIVSGIFKGILLEGLAQKIGVDVAVSYWRGAYNRHEANVAGV